MSQYIRVIIIINQHRVFGVFPIRENHLQHTQAGKALQGHCQESNTNNNRTQTVSIQLGEPRFPRLGRPVHDAVLLAHVRVRVQRVDRELNL